jgi:hypothetical protein
MFFLAYTTQDLDKYRDLTLSLSSSLLSFRFLLIHTLNSPHLVCLRDKYSYVYYTLQIRPAAEEAYLDQLVRKYIVEW